MNPIPPSVFAQQPMTYGHADQPSGMEAMQTGSSARPTAFPLPASVKVGPLTLHIGRLVTTLPENEIRLLQSALDASATKALLAGSPTADGLCSYHIQPRDHFADQPLRSQLPEQMLVSCELDQAMNVKQMFVGSVQGKIYCHAYFEPPATAAQALPLERAAPTRGGPQRTNLAFFSGGAQPSGEPEVNRTQSTHTAPPQAFLGAHPLGTRVRHARPEQKSNIDQQIINHLYQGNGLRTTAQVATALREQGVKVDEKRISQIRRDAGGRISRPGVSDEEIIKRLYHEGQLRTRQEVLESLHADGFGADGTRVTKFLQQARQSLPSNKATEEQINACLQHDGESGGFRNRAQIAQALTAQGLKAGKNRIAAALAVAKRTGQVPSADLGEPAGQGPSAS